MEFGRRRFVGNHGGTDVYHSHNHIPIPKDFAYLSAVKYPYRVAHGANYDSGIRHSYYRVYLGACSHNNCVDYVGAADVCYSRY